jgi:hypothetical protein
VTDDQWDVLREIVDSCGLSRHELARTICEGLGWVRPNGGLKARGCYGYLETKGLLTLPGIQGGQSRRVARRHSQHLASRVLTRTS